MSEEEPERSRRARAAAELALVSVAYYYGAKPGFVLLGGLVPELLCSDSAWLHAGTTDVDVQVNLEIAAGASNAGRLEQALKDAHFRPSDDKVWRWNQIDADGRKTIVKFELLADLDTERAEAVINFVGAKDLGAVNLRGTGYATKGTVEREFSAEVDGDLRVIRLDVAGLAGYLIAKAAAAHGRNKDKDWYDIAFVLLHNDTGGHREAAQQMPPSGCSPRTSSTEPTITSRRSTCPEGRAKWSRTRVGARPVAPEANDHPCRDAGVAGAAPRTYPLDATSLA